MEVDRGDAKGGFPPRARTPKGVSPVLPNRLYKLRALLSNNSLPGGEVNFNKFLMFRLGAIQIMIGQPIISIWQIFLKRVVNPFGTLFLHVGRHATDNQYYRMSS